jgi:hypothetical protein
MFPPRGQRELHREAGAEPEATYLRESDEENTKLRDALQQAVIVTNSLAG